MSAKRLSALILSCTLGLGSTPVLAKPVAKALPSKKAATKAAPAPSTKARARLDRKPTAPPRTRAKNGVPATKTGKKPAPREPRHPNPYLEALPDGESERTPAYLYANLDNEGAYSELDRRRLPYQREPAGPDGVRAPIRLTGPLHGVTIHSSLPESERASSRFEVLDARLALALDDFCALLAEHQIVEIVHYTMYRPGASPKAESDALPTRHPGGLAIDVGAVRKSDGQWLDVRRVWQPDVGERTCGPGAKRQENPLGNELVSLVCEARSRRLFHYVLTPHYDRQHHDHLHLEIKPAVKWFLVN